MRRALFYNPRLLLERVAELSKQLRRSARLRKTVARDLHYHHLHSLELLELARQWRPTVIYDIGAHIGTWTRLAKAVLPFARIHAFEALPNHARDFATQTKGISGVTLHPIALGAARCSAAFHLGLRTDESSFLTPRPMIERPPDESTESIQMLALDDYVAERSLPSPQLIKLDVQGYEMEVLRGASTALAHASCVLSEVSFVEYYEGQPLFADLVTFLNEHDFVPYAFAATMPTGEPVAQSDVLFVTRSLLSK